MSASFFPPSKLKPCQEDALGGASDVAEESKVIFFFSLKDEGGRKGKEICKANQISLSIWLD